VDGTQGAGHSGSAETHHISGVKNVVAARNIYVAHGVEAPDEIAGLRVNGMRAIRARWPNGDPEYQLFPDGWVSEAKWSAPKKFPAAEDITVNTPNRSIDGPCSSTSGYCYYVTGVGGSCAGLGYEPPSGYTLQPWPCIRMYAYSRPHHKILTWAGALVQVLVLV
jgi:hypothetical protein